MYLLLVLFCEDLSSLGKIIVVKTFEDLVQKCFLFLNHFIVVNIFENVLLNTIEFMPSYSIT
jgi:hypothetical protein